MVVRDVVMAPSSAQILVVENEARTAVQIQRELERLGYPVTVLASSVADAVAKAAETHPDLVVMDAMRRDAGESIEAAREMRDRFGIPVAYVQINGRPPVAVPQGTSPLLDSLRAEIDKELNLTIDEALNHPRADARSLVWEPTKRAPHTESRVHDSQWLGTILRAVADGVVATDREGVVRFINPVAQELTGWSEPKALGKPIGLIVSSEPPVAQRLVPVIVGENRHSATVEAMLVRADGRRTAIEQNATPIHDESGRPAGFVYVLRDISERRRVQAELEQMNRLKSDFVATISTSCAPRCT